MGRRLPCGTTILFLLAALGGVGGASAHNLVVNGSFEQGVPAADFLTPSLPGWTVANGGEFVLLRGGVAFEGNVALVLGLRGGPRQIYQDIPTLPGAVYQLRFYYSGEPGTFDNHLRVYWNGFTVADYTADGSSLTTPDWTTTLFPVLYSAGNSTRLTFEDLSNFDLHGGIVDYVVVESVTPLLDAVLSASSPVAPGGTVTYTLVVRNLGHVTQRDNPGDELTDTLPAGLTLLDATATLGTATVDLGTNTVHWSGSLPGESEAVLTIRARAGNLPEGTVLANQATVHFDPPGNGVNVASALSDDPSTAAAADPTRVEIRTLTILVPTLSTWGLLALATILAGLTFLRLRRRVAGG